MSVILDILNLLVSLASSAFGVAALFRPAWLTGSDRVGPGELFYARMYAVRAVPFGLLAGILPFWCTGGAMGWLLFVAATVQVADCVLGVIGKRHGMIIGPLVAALVHVLCGLDKIKAGLML